MIVITGGMAQGKTAFAESMEGPILDNLEAKIKVWMEEGILEEQALWEKIEQEVGAICGSKADLWSEDVILILREIGCGIVPMDKLESQWREVTGRLACRMAKLASDVYKMEAGIAVKIK